MPTDRDDANQLPDGKFRLVSLPMSETAVADRAAGPERVRQTRPAAAPAEVDEHVLARTRRLDERGGAPAFSGIRHDKRTGRSIPEQHDLVHRIDLLAQKLLPFIERSRKGHQRDIEEMAGELAGLLTDVAHEMPEAAKEELRLALQARVEDFRAQQPDTWARRIIVAWLETLKATPFNKQSLSLQADGLPQDADRDLFARLVNDLPLSWKDCLRIVRQAIDEGAIRELPGFRVQECG